MTEKPHKGNIADWYKYYIGDVYIVRGRFDGHPAFHGERGHTSLVLHHDKATGEIETINSRYTLVGPEQSMASPYLTGSLMD